RFLRPAEMTHAGRPKLRIRRSSKHSTSCRLLWETVHAAGPNDGANFQVRITSLPNGLIGGTSNTRPSCNQTLTRHQGDMNPSGHSEASTCLSALVTDWAIEAWYHPFIAGWPPTGGSHGKPHRTTKVLSDARRRGSGVAARGAAQQAERIRRVGVLMHVT